MVVQLQCVETVPVTLVLIRPRTHESEHGRPSALFTQGLGAPLTRYYKQHTWYSLCYASFYNIIILTRLKSFVNSKEYVLISVFVSSFHWHGGYRLQEFDSDWSALAGYLDNPLCSWRVGLLLATCDSATCDHCRLGYNDECCESAICDCDATMQLGSILVIR